MSIDSKKLKKILEKYDIITIDYYTLDGECAMIKCFMSKICEFLLIYVPSKLRFPVESSKNVYTLEDVEENTDNDDYSKSSKIPDMETIDEEKSVSSYKELSKKYQKHITLDGNDEPIQRKLKRQINRIRTPFTNLPYDIALQNNKFLCVSFGENISLFKIKNYNPTRSVRAVLFLINVKEFIDRLEDITEDIDKIKEQFYDILKKVSISNLDNISDQIPNYKNTLQNIESKREDYRSSIRDYNGIFEKIRIKEDDLIKNFKDKMKKEEGLKKAGVENDYQRQFDSIFKTKIDLVDKGVLLALKYQTNVLILEEVSFDNSVMIERVKKNFNMLNEVL